MPNCTVSSLNFQNLCGASYSLFPRFLLCCIPGVSIGLGFASILVSGSSKTPTGRAQLFYSQTHSWMDHGEGNHSQKPPLGTSSLHKSLPSVVWLQPLSTKKKARKLWFQAQIITNFRGRALSPDPSITLSQAARASPSVRALPSNFGCLAVA